MRWIAAYVVVLALMVPRCTSAANDQDYDRQFHSSVPLGAERIELHPGDRTLYLLTTVQSPNFEGWRASRHNDHSVLLTADGKPVRHYPDHLTFRFTATAMRPDMLAVDPYGSLNLAPEGINDFLLGLSFRLATFHGLEKSYLEPDSVRLIGMPADVPYEERVYDINFSIPETMPVEDRLVLEVFSPTGVRLCKFHMDLF